MKELLKTLTSIPAPGGNEDQLALWLKNRVKRADLKISTDLQGNIIITRNQTDKINTVLIAHMDEVFSVVRNIEDNGFIRIQLAPGLSPRDVYGHCVLVKAVGGWVRGKVGSIPNHLTESAQERVVPSRRELYVDIGCRSRQEVDAIGVRVGSAVVFERVFFENNGHIFATALDDRGGIAAIVELLEQHGLPPHVAIVFSVQEEFLLRGSIAAIRSLAPALLVVVDAMLAFDTPDLVPYCPVALGCGPVLATYTFHGKGEAIGVVQKPHIVDFIAQLAQQNAVNLQLGVYQGFVTEGSFSQLEGKGAISLEIGFPLRYAHSSIEVCNLSDLEGLVKLLQLIIDKGVVKDLMQLL
jgi:putative aminopeptidase FrvX